MIKRALPPLPQPAPECSPMLCARVCRARSKTVARRNGIGESTLLHMAAALLSAFVATLACNPADVLKSRVMAAASTGGGGSTLGVALHIAQHEGPLGFYRGFLPAFARIGPTIFIQLPVAEQLRRLMGVQPL